MNGHKCGLRHSRGFFTAVVVTVLVVGLAGTAFIVSVALTSSANRRTQENLLSNDQSRVDSVTDQQIRNLRNEVNDNLSLGTGYAGLGTATLPSGSNSTEVAVRGAQGIAIGLGSNAVEAAMRDPDASFNRNNGIDRPTGGTQPTNGEPPPEDIELAIAPGNVTLDFGESQAFSASVSGTSNQQVQWDVLLGGAGGAITTSGVYVAPDQEGDDFVRAISLANPQATEVALVSIASVTQCDDLTQAGGDEPRVLSIDLGTNQAVFGFSYEMYAIKDQMTILHDGGTVYDSGCVSGSNSVSLQINGGSSVIQVRVNPNCDGTTGTAWNFTVNCPQL